MSDCPRKRRPSPIWGRSRLTNTTTTSWQHPLLERKCISTQWTGQRLISSFRISCAIAAVGSCRLHPTACTRCGSLAAGEPQCWTPSHPEGVGHRQRTADTDTWVVIKKHNSTKVTPRSLIAGATLKTAPEYHRYEDHLNNCVISCIKLCFLYLCIIKKSTPLFVFFKVICFKLHTVVYWQKKTT